MRAALIHVIVKNTELLFAGSLANRARLGTAKAKLKVSVSFTIWAMGWVSWLSVCCHIIDSLYM